jgi:2-polyprenyl-3-methyl-5-hydroxy-6-metoxy-1,4-benzoquinol methylase
MEASNTGWSLNIKNQSWVEDTENQVEFIINTLELTGKERILDLACGFGRHSISLARRGYSVVGVDFTKIYIEDAIMTTKAESLSAEFILSDFRDLTFKEEFDVVLNMADGAIGYLETDEENLKMFDVISAALKSGGKHFMDVCNAEHAELYFPKRHWDIGTKTLSLPEFDWDSERRRMLFTDWEIKFDEIAKRPDKIEKDTDGCRLYSRSELEEILNARNMKLIKTFSNYYGKEATPKEIQLLVYSIKE